ncbi:pentapeptide repeat-containing protein [Streptomyces sp. NRRL S-237]|uniref:pentapeptide repeat-containing protein n=1 Tax=Streptomyces sp. NRRL S-237 TaxID=1463895 RepID=UPI000A861BFE|nr:pentapeptide repeat-containing protein [Streptomyces sp. NRRL S-237]
MRGHRLGTPGPPWPHCGEGATAADPVGCHGRQVPGEPLCLAHLIPAARARYLATLSPGDDIDHSGTTFTGSLLNDLLHALRDPASNCPHLGRARFEGATFSADAMFSRARFSADATFNYATFSADAWFNYATFSADAAFYGARFSAEAWFNGARFSGITEFNGVAFSGFAWFNGARFSGDAMFEGATFATTALFGPLICHGRLDHSSDGRSPHPRSRWCRILRVSLPRIPERIRGKVRSVR